MEKHKENKDNTALEGDTLTTESPTSKRPDYKRLTAVEIQRRVDECILLRYKACLLYTSPSPRDRQKSRMPSSA